MRGGVFQVGIPIGGSAEEFLRHNETRRGGVFRIGIPIEGCAEEFLRQNEYTIVFHFVVETTLQPAPTQLLGF